jgi:hypothetical protein
MIAAHAPQMSSTVSANGMLRTLGGQLRGRSVAAMDWLRQAMCSLRGHALMMHFESKRLTLQCASCGHTTPGWTISDGH